MNWIDAKAFLQRVVAWPINGIGHVNLHYSMTNARGGKDIVTGKPYQKIDDLLSFCNWAETTNNIKELWYCTSLQSTAGTNSKGGPKAIRLKANAIQLKAIWVDVDVKDDEHHYRTIDEAWTAICKFRVDTGLPMFSAAVKSGGGLHIYWISQTGLDPADWQPYAEGLKALLVQHGIKCDAGLTTDSARILRIPGTLNHKYTPPKPVELLPLPAIDYDFQTALAKLPTVAPVNSVTVTETDGFAALVGKTPIIALDPNDTLSAGLREDVLLDPKPMFEKCRFLQDAHVNGGRDYENPLWNLTLLCSTFMENGNALAHEMSKGHVDYTYGETQTQYERKVTERQALGLGYPQCSTILSNGCTACATCPLLSKGKSPLNIRPGLTVAAAPATELSFVDPYAEFVGPPFPVDVLPPTLANFVDAQNRSLGADVSAIAMAALAALAGAMHAETQVRVGEGWWEKPIFWAMLVGEPSSKKSPILKTVKRPLSLIDHERRKAWAAAFARWQQDKKADKTIPAPLKPARCIINDATPEKVAEILSRDPSGSLMVHDELAGWLGGFERYSAASPARAFYLECWNGGIFLKDRVGKGTQDEDAETSVENLALCILGGIQPDRLLTLGDLTSDGLLQRFMPVLMKCAERGDQDYKVAQAEADYDELIRLVNEASPQTYVFAEDALEVRHRILDYLHRLGTVDGFSSAQMAAICKLDGYFARICLLLHVAERHDVLIGNATLPAPLGPLFPRSEGERLRNLFGLKLSDCLSAGINVQLAISRRTAEAAEKLVCHFSLPNIFGFYDLVVNGGKERDKLRSIGNFILACDKERLRPSDLSAGVRSLKGETEQKIRDWAGRFCAMDWLQPEEGKPGVPPKAWLVSPGLREHFIERRKQAQAARAEAHAILKAGGTRRAS